MLLVGPLFLGTAAAEEPDAQLEIKILGGMPLPFLLRYKGGVIKNISNETAYNISFTISVKGGVLGLINETHSGYYGEILPHENLAVRINNVYGFGSVTVTLTAWASNAEKVTGNAKGFQLLEFTWVPFSWLHPNK